MNIIVNENTPEFVTWFASVNKLEVDYMTENFPSLTPEKISYVMGTRYIKILRGNSAHAFIDRSNGDVLKAASWRAPAKHARGNLYDTTNGMGQMGPYGPAYLR